MKKETEEQANKKIKRKYISPRLVRYGDFQSLTTKSGGISDGSGTNPSRS